MRRTSDRTFQQGDWVVYEVHKASAHPGPRARRVVPSPRGEDYSYAVAKHWIVAAVRGERLIVRTRRGKIREVARDDPSLRRPSLWERLTERRRVPRLAPSPEPVAKGGDR